MEMQSYVSLILFRIQITRSIVIDVDEKKFEIVSFSPREFTLETR